IPTSAPSTGKSAGAQDRSEHPRPPPPALWTALETVRKPAAALTPFPFTRSSPTSLLLLRPRRPSPTLLRPRQPASSPTTTRSLDVLPTTKPPG
ncbi:unnamed protein product, partial [Ectocarpus sp. 13 AM-2016]